MQTKTLLNVVGCCCCRYSATSLPLRFCCISVLQCCTMASNCAAAPTAADGQQCGSSDNDSDEYESCDEASSGYELEPFSANVLQAIDQFTSLSSVACDTVMHSSKEYVCHVCRMQRYSVSDVSDCTEAASNSGTTLHSKQPIRYRSTAFCNAYSQSSNKTCSTCMIVPVGVCHKRHCRCVRSRI
jgi:hypothetical protein